MAISVMVCVRNAAFGVEEYGRGMQRWKALLVDR
jgi:hypothetical protein